MGPDHSVIINGLNPFDWDWGGDITVSLQTDIGVGVAGFGVGVEGGVKASLITGKAEAGWAVDTGFVGRGKGTTWTIPRDEGPSTQNTDLLRSLTDAINRVNKNALEAKISGEENWQRYKHELDRVEEMTRSASTAGNGVKSGNEPIMDEDLFGIPGPGPAYGYNSNGFGTSGNRGEGGRPGGSEGGDLRREGGGAVVTKTSGDSWADRHGGGGGGADSGKGANGGPSKTTTVTKDGNGNTKTTTTTKWESGVTRTKTKQTIDTPAGKKEVVKTETKAAPKPKDDPRKTGPQPVLLDLDGDGVKITEYQNSTQFMTGKDGFQHRSSWAGAGDGVLFYDPDGRNAITEHRQYVFTEWNPTAAGDLEALRSIWDTNGDGKLSAADAEFAKFKVMVTNADGSTTVMTLAALGITEINLTANTVNIELPDGSVITGQTTFTRANGTTGTVANTTLTADAAGYRWDGDARLAA